MSGNVQKRPDGSWRARYRDPTHREHARHFRRKVDAVRWLASQEVSRTRGEWIDPAMGRLTVGQWLVQWITHQVQLKPSTLKRYEVAIRCQILPTWERVPLAQVTHSDVSAWVGRLSASGLAPATVRYAYRVLSLALAAAVRDGRVTRNVAEGVRLPRVSKSEKVFLTHEQVATLADACAPYQLLVRVLAYTGLRWGELAALKVKRVDLVRRRLDIAEASTEAGGYVVVGTPKTHQRRSVPIPRFLIAELAGHMTGKSPDDLVFTAQAGTVLRNSNFRPRIFDPAAASVGLAGLTPHELRHTAASLAVAAGANVKVVQLMLGHASAAMTLDVYAGLFGDDLDSVAERLDAAFTSSSADQVRTNEAASTDPLSHRTGESDSH